MPDALDFRPPDATVNEGALDSAFDAAVNAMGIDDDGGMFAPKAEPYTGTPHDDEPAPDQQAPRGKSAERAEQQPDPQKPPEEPDQQPKAAEAPDARKDADDADDEDVLLAPGHWSPERRAAFGKLAPDVRQFVMDVTKDTEEAFQQRTLELEEDQNLAQGIRSLITPEHRQQMREAGHRSEVEAMAHLVKLSDLATRDFPGYVRWAVERAGVDPRQVFPELVGGQPPTYGQPQQGQPYAGAPARPSDPRPMTADLRHLSGRLEAIERDNAARQAQAHTERQRQADDIVARFESAKDDQGNLLYPHFPALREKVAKLLNTDLYEDIPDRNKRLEEAYWAAVGGDEKARAAEIDRAAAARRAEARAQRDRDRGHRRPAINPSRSTFGAGAPAQQQSLDDLVTSAMNNAMA